MAERTITVTVDETDLEEAAAEIESRLEDIGVLAEVTW